MQKIESTLDASNVLQYLRELEPNWDSYGARVIDFGIISLAEYVLSVLTLELYPEYIAPLASGGLQFEWREYGDSWLEITFEGVDSIAIDNGGDQIISNPREDTNQLILSVIKHISGTNNA